MTTRAVEEENLFVLDEQRKVVVATASGAGMQFVDLPVGSGTDGVARLLGGMNSVEVTDLLLDFSDHVKSRTNK